MASACRSPVATAFSWAAITLSVLQPSLTFAQSAQVKSVSNVSAESLDRYSSAFVRISKLRREARRQESMMPENERRVLGQRLALGIEQALERAGLKRAEFNRITRQIEVDPELRRRVRQRVMEKVVGV